MIQENWVFVVILQKIGKKLHFIGTRVGILMSTSCVFITSDYFIRFWYSHLRFWNSEVIHSRSALINAVRCWISKILKLRKSALNSADSEPIICETALIKADWRWLELISAEFFGSEQRSEKIRADHVWNSADQHWYFSCSLYQRCTALKNVKSQKQRRSALNSSGVSTREFCHRMQMKK